MKRNRWIERYHSVLLELAESDLRFPELCRCIELAQEAMNTRSLELQNDQGHALERRALEHALQNLQSAMQNLAANASQGRA